MKVNTCKRDVDLNLLDYSIDAYCIKYHQIDPYLIMSESTAGSLIKKTLCNINENDMVEYSGCKILLDDSLQFGVVDIR